jgi:hypothetical protein
VEELERESAPDRASADYEYLGAGGVHIWHGVLLARAGLPGEAIRLSERWDVRNAKRRMFQSSGRTATVE